MAVVWILTRRPLPPRLPDLILALALTLLPACLVIIQPDLGTAVLLIISGLLAIFLGRSALASSTDAGRSRGRNCAISLVPAP